VARGAQTPECRLTALASPTRTFSSTFVGLRPAGCPAAHGRVDTVDVFRNRTDRPRRGEAGLCLPIASPTSSPCLSVSATPDRSRFVALRTTAQIGRVAAGAVGLHRGTCPRTSTSCEASSRVNCVKPHARLRRPCGRPVPAPRCPRLRGQPLAEEPVRQAPGFAASVGACPAQV
jgi:hypothetical protein